MRQRDELITVASVTSGSASCDSKASLDENASLDEKFWALTAMTSAPPVTAGVSGSTAGISGSIFGVSAEDDASVAGSGTGVAAPAVMFAAWVSLYVAMDRDPGWFDLTNR